MENRPSVIFFTDGLDADALGSFALRLEDLGYESLCVSEFFGREPFSTVSFLLARTSRLRIATGIANVYSRDALITAQARQTLAELSGGRFILGLGVSHPQMAEAWGSEQKIRERMAEHLDAGASHIAVSPLNPEGKGPQPHWKLLEALAP
jgi:alkanesulfonate monooxygenase SsuD/methylene tetrahydromethanopterin reductase-like flavin-dependent oxidoreductase (luciferase family)